MYAFSSSIAVSTRISTSLSARLQQRPRLVYAALSSPIRRLRIDTLSTSTTSISLCNDVPAPTKPQPNVKRSSITLQARLFLARLAHISRSLARFREKYGMQFQYARLAMASIFALIFFQRMLFSPTASMATLATTASAEAGVAIPSAGHFGGLLTLVPEGMKIALKPFTESFGVVFLSEFGDKSMFATALMAMKHSPSLVLIGALIALTMMTLIACFLGQLMHLLPTNITHYSTIALFMFFGFQMLWSARKLSSVPGQGNEKKDAEELVSQNLKTNKRDSSFSVLAKISSLIFVAEWCDRSMIATMALAATSNSLAVVGGATVANIVCTGFAVGSAALVASKISERTVAIIAGILFEFFAVFTWFEGPEGQPAT